jgi:hypothetical protein
MVSMLLAKRTVDSAQIGRKDLASGRFPLARIVVSPLRACKLFELLQAADGR